MNTPTQRPANILIVDDTPENLQLLARLLGRSGYTVRPVVSGNLALQAVRLLLPDLILLDVRMPQMDGYEVCQELKSADPLRHIPVIFISADDEDEDKMKAFQAGGVDYIVKPFQAEVVLARVRTHLELYRLQQELRSRNSRPAAPAADGLDQSAAGRIRELEVRVLELEELYHRAPCGYHSLDRDGVFIRINDTELGWLGYAREEVIGRNITGFLAPKSCDQFASRFVATKASDNFYNFELELQGKGGRLLPVSVSVTVVRDAAGNFIRSQSTVFNNSELKKTEASLRQALAAADAAGKVRTELLSALAHKLRTPMNTIMGYTQMVQRETSLSESVRAQIEIIDRSSQKLLALINSFFEPSKNEPAGVAEPPAPAELLEPLTVADMSAVPADLRRQLHGALVGADYDAVNQVIREIGAVNPGLASRLNARAERFEVENLIHLLESSRQETIK